MTADAWRRRMETKWRVVRLWLWLIRLKKVRRRTLTNFGPAPGRMRNLTILNSQPLSSQHVSMMVDYNQGLRASAGKLSTQLLIELHPIIRVANWGYLAGWWRFGTFVWREKFLGAGRF